jgi:hypothetical protein
VHICPVTTLRILPLSRPSVEKAPHRLLSLSSSFARSLRAYVIRGPILQDQDWTVQGYDEILITIENKPRLHQSLVATSDHRFYVAQVFCLFTSIVNVGRGPFTGSDSTALPPLRKQRLRHKSSSDRFDSFSTRTSCTSVVRTLVQSAPLWLNRQILAPLWLNPSHICTESLHLCGSPF